MAEMSLNLFKICEEGHEKTICCPLNHTESCKTRCDCSKASNMTRGQLISKFPFGHINEIFVRIFALASKKRSNQKIMALDIANWMILF